MAYIVIIAMLALIQFIYFSVQVGRARGRCDVAAPATTGNEEFERYFRVQQNTLEQLVVFLPALVAAATFGNEFLAAPIGRVYLIGRALYARAYVRDPGSRTIGFLLGLLANVALIGAALWGAIQQAF
ncbi:MAG: hypothetical protein CMQ22_05730 [Gammaproteobacteria bacterium]|nr:hypothetical protein [Gammaproteobacteria bacterium]